MDIYLFTFDHQWVSLKTDQPVFEITKFRLNWNDKGFHAPISLFKDGKHFKTGVFPLLSESENGKILPIKKWDTWTTRARCKIYTSNKLVTDQILNLRMQAKVDKPSQNPKNWRVIIDYFPLSQFEHLMQRMSQKSIEEEEKFTLPQVKLFVLDFLQKLFPENIGDQNEFLRSLQTHDSFSDELKELKNLTPVTLKAVNKKKKKLSTKRYVLTSNLWKDIIKEVESDIGSKVFIAKLEKKAKQHRAKFDFDPEKHSIEARAKANRLNIDIPQKVTRDEFIIFLIQHAKKFGLKSRKDIKLSTFSRFGYSSNIDRQVDRICAELNFESPR